MSRTAVFPALVKPSRETHVGYGNDDEALSEWRKELYSTTKSVYSPHAATGSASEIRRVAQERAAFHREGHIVMGCDEPVTEAVSRTSYLSPPKGTVRTTPAVSRTDRTKSKVFSETRAFEKEWASDLNTTNGGSYVGYYGVAPEKPAIDRTERSKIHFSLGTDDYLREETVPTTSKSSYCPFVYGAQK